MTPWTYRRAKAKTLYPAAVLAVLFGTAAWGQMSLRSQTLAEGLQEPHGVAVHPDTGEVWVAERGANRISKIQGDRATPVIQNTWALNESTLPRWAISEQVPFSKWTSVVLEKPGPISFATNGNLFVAEQVPHGRLLEFSSETTYQTANGVPVPWLEQEFQWRDVFVDSDDRLFVAGMDEIGSPVLKFGSALMRDINKDWWVIDFGPFSQFSTFALSAQKDVLLVGDKKKGALTWWEVDRRIMLGGMPDTVGRAELLAVAIYPDGGFVVAEQVEPGKAQVKYVDPHSGQQIVLNETFRSIGAIAIDRPNRRFIISDPVAGRVVECKPSPDIEFHERILRAMVRSLGNMAGFSPSETPAFLNTFFERLESAAKDLLPDDGSTHGISFNLSDIAGRLPVVAGRVRTVLEVEGEDDDPIEQIDFFLLFPSKFVMTDKTATPSLSFFSLRRKSGAVEQTMPVTSGDSLIYRVSGTNRTLVARSATALYVPVVTCGLEERDGGLALNLGFLGMGVYPNYQLLLYQGPREKSARLITENSTMSGRSRNVYEASFMEDATIEGMDGKITREEITNLLVSGFESGSQARASIGWMRLGQFPAWGQVAFSDTGVGEFTGVEGDLKSLMDKSRIELDMQAADNVLEPVLDTGAPAQEGNQE